MVALAALVRATRLSRKPYPGREGRADRASLDRLGRDQPVGEAVARAIAAIEAVDAVIAADAGAHGSQG